MILDTHTKVVTKTLNDDESHIIIRGNALHSQVTTFDLKNISLKNTLCNSIYHITYYIIYL